MRPSTSTPDFDTLPSDTNERHEAVIEILGRHLFALRNQAIATVTSSVCATQESRSQMGSFHRAEYDAVAALPPNVRDAALALSQKSVDLFLQYLLTLFTHSGLSTDIGAGPEHAIAYEIVLKFIRCDNLEPVESHTVNKDGEKVFSEYFGRWLNRHSDA